MLHRIAIYLVVGAGLAIALIVQRGQLRAPQREALPISAPGSSLREPAEETFRLGPDARFLIAAGHLYQLLTGAPPRPADVRFEGERWHVVQGDVEIGTLPEYPDYPDLMAVLGAWAVQLGARRLVTATGAGDPEAVERELTQLHALRAARLTDRRWSAGDHSLGLLVLGARALVLLELENPDRVGASDAVAARALALTALARALDPNLLARESCLLSSCMGYGAFARTAARRLDPEDPVRLFVRGEEGALATRASGKRGTPEARYLSLVGTAPVSDPDRWTRQRQRWFGRDDDLALPLLWAGPATERPEGAAPAALTVMLAAGRDLGLLEVATPPDSAREVERALGRTVNDFEALLDSVRPTRGVCLDPALLRAYYRGCFYSALYATGGHVRDGHPAGVRALARQLVGVRPGPGAEFAGWCAHLADAGAGQANRAALAGDLRTLPHFGAPLRIAAYEALCEQSPADDLWPRRAAVRLAGRLDSRPGHRGSLGWIAYHDLLALDLAEELLTSATRAGGPLEADVEAWWAVYTNDRARLEGLVARRDLGADEEALSLEAYAALPGVDSAAAGAAWRRSIARDPDAWALVAGYAGCLERAGAREAARRAVLPWLDRNIDRAGLEVTLARTTLARLYEGEGRYAEGFAVVASVVASQHPEAMDRAARLLDHLGRSEQAETLAVFAAERCPDSLGARALVAELFWRHDKPGLAARALGAPAAPESPDAWRAAFGPGFVTCFRDRLESGIAAADSILARVPGPEYLLTGLASACADSGDDRLACEVEARVHPPAAQRPEHLVRQYRYLARWKGGVEAALWLARTLQGASEADLAALGRVAFRANQEELLWAIHPDLTTPEGESHWLLRAAAAMRNGSGGGTHAQELAAHFAAPEGGRARVLGRYLLGLQEESQVWALDGEPGERCELFYFLGLKAQSQGHYRDAARWYSRCLGTHQTQTAAFGWARDQLWAWRERGMSLERIAAEDGKAGPGPAT